MEEKIAFMEQPKMRYLFSKMFLFLGIIVALLSSACFSWQSGNGVGGLICVPLLIPLLPAFPLLIIFSSLFPISSEEINSIIYPFIIVLSYFIVGYLIDFCIYTVKKYFKRNAGNRG